MQEESSECLVVTHTTLQRNRTLPNDSFSLFWVSLQHARELTKMVFRRRVQYEKLHGIPEQSGNLQIVEMIHVHPLCFMSVAIRPPTTTPSDIQTQELL
ncbi:hypothetical protein RUM43_005677 [Polyplax serrata]|uniref:Uncharacterized protein n=1 Tax=Polyplax serrata TaxID=468196 RepID=A0AAN8PJT3_POLSC